MSLEALLTRIRDNVESGNLDELRHDLGALKGVNATLRGRELPQYCTQCGAKLVFDEDTFRMLHPASGECRG